MHLVAKERVGTEYEGHYCVFCFLASCQFSSSAGFWLSSLIISSYLILCMYVVSHFLLLLWHYGQMD